MITGKELYLKYISANSINGILIDGWDDLEDREKTVWVTLALMLNESKLLE